MGFFGTAYILCGIFYIIACIMDGQDVKPIWKKWVSGKLEKAANYFFPIKYVTKVVKEYVPMCPPTPWERFDYDRITFDGVKVQSGVLISESDFMMAQRRYPYSDEDNKEILIKERKSDCLNTLFRKITEEKLVNIDIDTETRWPHTVITAWMYVGRRRK